jgi:hypothetical protein
MAAKQMTTRLWSLFAQNPARYKRIEITFEDRKGNRKIRTEVPGNNYGRGENAAFVAAIIASRVRVRLLEELIPLGPVQVDTDGGIVPSTAYAPGWTEKKRMETVEVRSSQAYRWQCPDCPTCPERHPRSPWHYSVAGIRTNEPLLPDIFERTPPNRLLKWRWQGAISIPAQTIGEAKRWVGGTDIDAIPDETL